MAVVSQGRFQCNTVEPVLKDHPIGRKNVVCQDKWSLVTGSVILKCRSFCQKMCGLLRQVIPHASGLSRQVSLSPFFTLACVLSTWYFQSIFYAFIMFMTTLAV